MRVFQRELFNKKSALGKRIIVVIAATFFLFNLNAQKKTNLKLSMETGLLLFSNDSDNLGLFLNVEPKVKVLKHTFIGLRFGLTLNSHTFENHDSFQYTIDENFDNAVLSFLPTIDYYLIANEYLPFIGVGVGYYVLPDPIEVFPSIQLNPSEVALEGNVNKRLGFLLRGGFEKGKIRLGFEYNYTPIADVKLPSGQSVGTVDNSYIGLSIGFVISSKKSAYEKL